MRALSHALRGGHRPLCLAARNAADRALLRFRIGPMLVPASDSGPGEKRCCCSVDEIPHKWASKLAPIPRKADG